jgi:hypothetical protein
MSGAIPPLPNTSSWRAAQSKHRDSFTFTFYLWSLSYRYSNVDTRLNAETLLPMVKTHICRTRYPIAIATKVSGFFHCDVACVIQPLVPPAKL